MTSRTSYITYQLCVYMHLHRLAPSSVGQPASYQDVNISPLLVMCLWMTFVPLCCCCQIHSKTLTFVSTIILEYISLLSVNTNTFSALQVVTQCHAIWIDT